MQKRGKFIVLYGINNLGKTTQAQKLVERMNTEGIKAEYLKYPIYDIEPSGKMINDYLRNGNPYELSSREAQTIYALNRGQYEPELKRKLDEGINIISEDYTGTGLCWGIGTGTGEDFLKEINSHLLKEDIAFLFNGERFMDSVEKTHRNETNNELTNNVREIHKRLGEEFGWININANLSIEEIHEQLWNKIQEII